MRIEDRTKVRDAFMAGRSIFPELIFGVKTSEDIGGMNFDADSRQPIWYFTATKGTDHQTFVFGRNRRTLSARTEVIELSMSQAVELESSIL